MGSELQPATNTAERPHTDHPLDDDAVLDALRNLPPVPQSVDLDHTQRFLHWLDPVARFFTFQLIYPDGRTPVIHGPLAGDLAKRLERENLAGASIYVMINEGDGRGRKTENVTRVRSIFVDSDGTPLPPPDDLQAQAIVQSSNVPHKWHAYWRVQNVPLRYFAAIQKGLIATYSTDKGVHDLPRVMRVPGHLHLKAEPFMTRAWWLDHDAPPLTLADICARWPLVAEAVHQVDHPPPEAPSKPLPDRRKGSYGWAALEAEYGTLKDTLRNRHDALLQAARRLGRLIPHALTEEEVTEALKIAVNANGYDRKVPASEIDRTIRDGITYGKQSPRPVPA